MITLDLKVDNTKSKVKIKDEILFNAVLAKNPKLIKKLIKSIHPFYKIHKDFFEIVNTYVDFTKNGVSLYPGLIVRTGLIDYAVLYLEDVFVDEEYLIKVIDDYVKDFGYCHFKEININKFEINKKVFVSIIKNM